ncbi:MAG: hypothetical protein IJV01_07190 [Bacteroidales bacterium]|nr:hypothetical protein [Bacteroidales bacterium]
MKHLHIFAALLPLFVLASCSKTSSPAPEMVFRTFGAQMNQPVNPDRQDGRAVLNGTSVVWQEGDRIAIVPKGKTTIYPFTLASGAGTTSATFAGECPDGADDTYYAFYPYHPDSLKLYSGTVTGAVYGGSVSSQKITSFSAAFSHVQHAVENNIDPYLNFCFAESNNGTFVMKNLLSLLKFQVSDSDVNMVVFNSTESKKYLAGGRLVSRFIAHSDGEPFFQCLGSTGRKECVVVLPPKGETTFSTGKTYYAAVVSKMGGYSGASQPQYDYKTRAILYKNGYYSYKSSASKLTLNRNTIYDCGTLAPDGTGWTGWKGLTTNNVTASFASKTYNKTVSGATVTATADFPTESNTTTIAPYFKIGGSAWAKITISQNSSAFRWDEANTSLFCNCGGGTRTGFEVSPLVYKPISRLVFTFVKVEGDSATPEVRLCEGITSSSAAYGSGICDLSGLEAGATKDLALDLDPYSIGCNFICNVIGKAHIRSIAIRYN